MTISITVSQCTFEGDGSSTTFPIRDGSNGIYFTDASEISVTVDGVAVSTSAYTVSGAGSDSGSVTFLAAPADGAAGVIERNTALTQSLSLTRGGYLSPSDAMAAWDKLTRIDQDQARRIAALESATEKSTDVITLNMADGKWDGENHELTNLSPATSATSAATYGQVQEAFAAAGTGDVIGPPSSVDDRIAIFDGTTGKILADGGKTISGVLSDAAAAATTIAGDAVSSLVTTLPFIDVTKAPYSAVADGTGDQATAINAAIAAAAAAGGGTVVIPKGVGAYRITSPIEMAAGVNLLGMGTPLINPVSCHGITFTYAQGFGSSRISGIDLYATTGTSSTGIIQSSITGTGGLLNDANELYGVTIDNCLIRNFNVGIGFTTVRDLIIDSCWIQDITQGISLVGKCLIVDIVKTRIVYGAGGGSGTQYGIVTKWKNYTSGTGYVRPEGVRIHQSTVYGFTTGVDFDASVYATLTESDIQATSVGVRYDEASSLTVIAGNYIQVAGSSGQYGIRGVQQSVTLNGKVVIAANDINAYNTTAGTTVGILLGVNGVGGNVDGLTIRDNLFSGFTLYDIAAYTSGDMVITGNRCFSSTPTYSILVSAVKTGMPIFISDNDCTKAIGYDGTDRTSGKVVIGRNVEAGVITDLTNPWKGTASFTAATTAAVSISQPDTSYQVHVEALGNYTIWITSKTTSGFTINVSSSITATLRWWVLR